MTVSICAALTALFSSMAPFPSQRVVGLVTEGRMLSLHLAHRSQVPIPGISGLKELHPPHVQQASHLGLVLGSSLANLTLGLEMSWDLPPNSQFILTSLAVEMKFGSSKKSSWIKAFRRIGRTTFTDKNWCLIELGRRHMLQIILTLGNLSGALLAAIICAWTCVRFLLGTLLASVVPSPASLGNLPFKRYCRLCNEQPFPEVNVGQLLWSPAAISEIIHAEQNMSALQKLQNSISSCRYIPLMAALARTSW